MRIEPVGVESAGSGSARRPQVAMAIDKKSTRRHIVVFPDGLRHNMIRLASADDVAAIGYAYATPWRARSAYRGSVESTVYIAQGYSRQGIGSQLYKKLLEELRARGIQVVLSGIAQPNPASVSLHEGLGFEKVAHFKRVGRKFGQWIDVGYWELQLDGLTGWKEDIS